MASNRTITDNDAKAIAEHLKAELLPEYTQAVLNRQQAATYLGISISKFDNIKHEICAVQIGSSLMYRKIDLDAYLDYCVVDPKQKSKSSVYGKQHQNPKVIR